MHHQVPNFEMRLLQSTVIIFVTPPSRFKSNVPALFRLTFQWLEESPKVLGALEPGRFKKKIVNSCQNIYSFDNGIENQLPGKLGHYLTVNRWLFLSKLICFFSIDVLQVSLTLQVM